MGRRLILDALPGVDKEQAGLRGGCRDALDDLDADLERVSLGAGGLWILHEPAPGPLSDAKTQRSLRANAADFTLLPELHPTTKQS